MWWKAGQQGLVCVGFAKKVQGVMPLGLEEFGVLDSPPALKWRE